MLRICIHRGRDRLVRIGLLLRDCHGDHRGGRAGVGIARVIIHRVRLLLLLQLIIDGTVCHGRDSVLLLLWLWLRLRFVIVILPPGRGMVVIIPAVATIGIIVPLPRTRSPPPHSRLSSHLHPPPAQHVDLIHRERIDEILDGIRRCLVEHVYESVSPVQLSHPPTPIAAAVGRRWEELDLIHVTELTEEFVDLRCRCLEVDVRYEELVRVVERCALLRVHRRGVRRRRRRRRPGLDSLSSVDMMLLFWFGHSYSFGPRGISSAIILFFIIFYIIILL
jgi:hypothetical protein